MMPKSGLLIRGARRFSAEIMLEQKIDGMTN